MKRIKFCGACAVVVITIGIADLMLIRNCYNTASISNDWRKADAIIVGESWSGHGAVAYEYRVNNSVYTGEGHQDIMKQSGKRFAVGGKIVVYYSASHLGLSTLMTPTGNGFGPVRWATIIIGEGFLIWLIVVWIRSLAAGQSSGFE